jgi:DNA repair exonuclease SbcCD ATPase subunit
MAYSKEYLEANREIINQKRREKYDPNARQAYYDRTRVEMLEKGKLDRACCPLCGLDFRRLYIPRHIATRHKM